MPFPKTFQKEARLRDKKQIATLFKQGKKLDFGPLKVKVLKPAEAVFTSRLVLGFNRKAGNAPLRNAWKRQVRESFRQSTLRSVGCDFAFYNQGPLPKKGIGVSVEKVFHALAQKWKEPMASKSEAELPKT